MNEPFDQFEARVMRLKHPQFMAEIYKRADVLMTDHGNAIFKLIAAEDAREDRADFLRKVAGNAVDSARPTLNKRANAPITMAEMKTVLLAVARAIR
jgi:hypothetical protein